MQRHFCIEEKTWLDFENKCSWCNLTEEQAARWEKLTANEKFQEIMQKKVHTLSDYIKKIEDSK